MRLCAWFVVMYLQSGTEGHYRHYCDFSRVKPLIILVPNVSTFMFVMFVFMKYTQACCISCLLEERKAFMVSYSIAIFTAWFTCLAIYIRGKSSRKVICWVAQTISRTRRIHESLAVASTAECYRDTHPSSNRQDIGSVTPS